MKILHVANNAAPQFGGAYHSIVLFREAAALHGYSTECVSFDDNPNQNLHCDNKGTWHIVPTRPGALGKHYALVPRGSTRNLAGLVESADIIFVHLLYRYHAIWAAQCARRFRKPLVIVPHGSLDPYVFTYRAFRKTLWLKAYRELLFKDSLVLYATDREKEKAAAAVGDVNAACLFWPIDNAASGLANKLPRPAPPPRRLLFVGRLHPVKRVLETVRAFRRANAPGWQLVLIGAETREIHAADLEAAAGSEWGRSIVYRGLLGRQSLYSEYTKASALILASHKENFGHVVAEAMLFGLPVIISEDVDLCTVVRQAGAGTVVPVARESDIFECLTKFLHLTQDELEKMGQAARIAARKHFAFRTFADSYCTILENLADQGAAHACEKAPTAA